MVLRNLLFREAEQRLEHPKAFSFSWHGSWTAVCLQRRRRVVIVCASRALAWSVIGSHRSGVLPHQRRPGSSD